MNVLASELKQRLAPVFEKMRGRISLVYLFGSSAKGDAGPGSDVDLAVLLPRGSTEKMHLDVKLDLYADCCRLLRRNDIDIVIMNKTRNLFLLDDVVSNGMVLFEEDAELREEYEVAVHHDFIDFRDQRMRIMGV